MPFPPTNQRRQSTVRKQEIESTDPNQWAGLILSSSSTGLPRGKARAAPLASAPWTDVLLNRQYVVLSRGPAISSIHLRYDPSVRPSIGPLPAGRSVGAGQPLHRRAIDQRSVIAFVAGRRRASHEQRATRTHTNTHAHTRTHTHTHTHARTPRHRIYTAPTNRTTALHQFIMSRATDVALAPIRARTKYVIYNYHARGSGCQVL